MSERQAELYPIPYDCLDVFLYFYYGSNTKNIKISIKLEQTIKQ